MQESTIRSEFRIVHLSDLHFGTVRQHLVDPLLRLLDDFSPRVVVVSGDLTQRAKEYQYHAASEFLARIRFPKVVVPGNHDVPLWNVIGRFADPFSSYRQHIAGNLEPSYQDEDLIVIGINTARAFTWKDGRISETQIKRLKSRLTELPREVFKVVVMHHPLIISEDGDSGPEDRRDWEARNVLESVRTDIVLAGHGHHRCSGRTGGHFAQAGNAILVIQAGTALSDRRRGTSNSFNVVDIERDAVVLTPYDWVENVNQFVAAPAVRFEKRGIWEQMGTNNADQVANRC